MRCTLVGIMFVMLAALNTTLAQPPGESPEDFEKRTRWWREAKFGMFIHWGIYAVPADATDLHGRKTIAEWYLSNKQMQVRDYEKFAAQFNPMQFNAREWVRIAKEAGRKYIVITSKHHDGFCMFDTKLTDYNIVKATPFRRDPMKELAEECRKQGIKLCFYYSIMDWHHPDYLPRRPWELQVRPPQGADLNRYIGYMKGQLRELMTNYGAIGVLWFDGGWEHNAQQLRSAEVNAFVRSLQPQILINDRNHLPEDFSTPEQTIPPDALPGGRLWETCMTINDTWGYARNDDNWKSAEELIRKLCDIAHKGGNFLLNVGPTAEGTFPQPIVERLQRIGQWMKVNGRSIYGSTASPFRKLPFDGRCTAKGTTLYLHVFTWPEGDLRLDGLETKVLEARALLGNEKLRVRTERVQGDEAEYTAVYISRPRRLDHAATVVELRLAGKPQVVQVGAVIRADSRGVILCHARQAQVHGQHARYEEGGGKDNIGFWTNASDYVTWDILVPARGSYRVTVTYACPPENAGSRFTVGVEGRRRLEGAVEATGSWTAFRDFVLGEVMLPAGRHTLSVRVTEMPRGAVMNLQKVMLERRDQ
ncbi:MAG: alpha-L-fucosidase [Armatimonadota bacterium]|nr:alpha-L-fucosidase [Armatimonadota bacterium]